MIDQKGYLGNQKLKRVSTLIQYTQEQLDAYRKTLENKFD